MKKNPPPNSTNDGSMPFLGHLVELRKRLIRYIVVLVLITLAAYGFRKEILDFIRKPVEGPLKKYTARITPPSTKNLALSPNLFNCVCQQTAQSTYLSDQSSDSRVLSGMTLNPASVAGAKKEVFGSAKEPSAINHEKAGPVINDPTSEIKNPDRSADRAGRPPEKAQEKAGNWLEVIGDTFNDFWIYYQVMTGKDPKAIEGLREVEEEKKRQDTAGLNPSGEISLSCSCSIDESQTIQDERHSSMVFIGIYELFFAQMKVAILAGVFFSFPYLLIELWGFVGPALYRGEKSVFWVFSISSYILFTGGALFGYSVVFPFGFDFFLSLTQLGEIMPSLSVGEYLNFAIKLLFAFGIVFEMPLVVFILSRLGLVTPRMMLNQTRLAIVVIFVVSAIITPPDPLTMMLMAGPLIILYIISIGVCYVGLNRQKAALREQGINPEDFEEP
ncbi:MAG: twin-arginine translocase subunit TatC [Deltaproteobacteria bacterium]|nr:twin-arginine translocase subunit TatC [Deltaproteobacteria bacterium]